MTYDESLFIHVIIDSSLHDHPFVLEWLVFTLFDYCVVIIIIQNILCSGKIIKPPIMWGSNIFNILQPVLHFVVFGFRKLFGKL